jgi:hypothetical protein
MRPPRRPGRLKRPACETAARSDGAAARIARAIPWIARSASSCLSALTGGVLNHLLGEDFRGRVGDRPKRAETHQDPWASPAG